MLKKSGVLALFVVSFASSALAMPKTVILIRHAEKPPEKSNIHLNERGYARAEALPSFFKKHGSVTELHLIAQGQKRADSSLRPIETLIPSSKEFNHEINKQFVKDESNAMVTYLASIPFSQTAVISWGHDEIGNISRLLGKDQGEWSSAIFDRAWIFEFNVDGKLAHFADVPQKLLPGDSEN